MFVSLAPGGRDRVDPSRAAGAIVMWVRFLCYKSQIYHKLRCCNCREQTTARRWLQFLRGAGQQRNKGERTHFPPLAALLDGQIFLWYCVSCAKGETRLCMQDLQRPSDFVCVVGPFVIVGCVGASTFLSMYCCEVVRARLGLPAGPSCIPGGTVWSSRWHSIVSIVF